MPKRTRHTAAEVAAKLAQADELAAEGRTQAEITRALGISIMTYHRWRKAHADRPAPLLVPEVTPVSPATPDDDRMAALQMENARLRKLVTDLLLEKMRLEEEHPHGGPSSYKNSR